MTEKIEQTKTDAGGVSNARRWLRMTRVGCLLILVWAIALNILAGELIPPVLVIGFVFGSLSIFLTKERRRLGLVTAILAVIALGGNLPGTIDELSHPSSAPAFILTLLVVVAAFVVIISGAAAFWKLSPEPIKALAITAAAVFGVGVLASLNAAAAIESAEPLSSDVKVVAQSVSFDESEIVVPAGESGFWLDNRDGIRHTFTIRGTDYEIDAPGFSSQRAEFDLAPGEYEVFCAVPGHENMQIDLVVEG